MNENPAKFSEAINEKKQKGNTGDGYGVVISRSVLALEKRLSDLDLTSFHKVVKTHKRRLFTLQQNRDRLNISHSC